MSPLSLLVVVTFIVVDTIIVIIVVAMVAVVAVSAALITIVACVLPALLLPIVSSRLFVASCSQRVVSRARFVR